MVWHAHSHITQVVAAMDSYFCLIRPRQHIIADRQNYNVGPRALCSLPFTTKTGAKHPFIKAPAPHDTCGSCWLCVRHLADYGFSWCLKSFFARSTLKDKATRSIDFHTQSSINGVFFVPSFFKFHFLPLVELQS